MGAPRRANEQTLTFPRKVGPIGPTPSRNTNTTHLNSLNPCETGGGRAASSRRKQTSDSN